MKSDSPLYAHAHPHYHYYDSKLRLFETTTATAAGTVYELLTPPAESALARRPAEAEGAELNCLARRGLRNEVKST